MKSILFICTGNVFRSMSAEHLFRKHLSERGFTGWKVASAGIVARPEPLDPKTIEVLEKMGVKINHRQKKLTRQMLDDYDIIVPMAANHLQFINAKFGFKNAFLFNDLALNKKSSIWDVEDKVKNMQNRASVEKIIEKTIKEIQQNIPKLFRNVSERFYLFSDFTSGLKSHRNGYPFITLFETKNSVSFMSIDIPSKEDGHILVIPKRKYVDLSDIPNKTLGEMLYSIQKIGKALTINHGGYNILLNNGADAGQYIFHTHFHIIPRNYNDGVKIESWDHQNISVQKFIKLNKELKKQINQAPKGLSSR